jgi:hypothetical protein
MRGGRGLVEGGMTAHLGTVKDYLNTLFDAAPYGMFDLRLGAGYAEFPNGQSPHLAAGLAWGYRFVHARTTHGGACDRPPEPDTVADATMARIVTTLRRPTELDAWEVQIALELSPSWVALPWRMKKRRYRD